MKRTFARSISLQTRVLIIVIVGIFFTLCNTVFLHNIASTSSNARGLKFPRTETANINHIAKSKTNKKNTSLKADNGKNMSINCPPFGCSIFPIEIPTARSEQQHSKSNYNYTAWTQRGLDHVVNQDRGLIVIPNLAIPNDDIGNRYDDGRFHFAMGIFDGHGDEGHKVSQHLQSNFFQKLDSKLAFQEKEDIKDAIAETFIEMDRELDPSIGNDGGSTAAVVLHCCNGEPGSFSHNEDVLYFASVGDSLCILVEKEKGNIIFRTKYDKPNSENERKRILEMGGKIHTPPRNPNEARSIAFSKTKNELFSLAMSRAIGDWEHLGVVATPHIDVVKLAPSQEGVGGAGFVVACGSDGMFGVRRPEFVAQQLAKFGVNRTAHLVEVATPKNPKFYRDDITLMALEIDTKGKL